MAKKNTKVTPEQRKKAIREVKRARDAFKIPNTLPEGQLALALEYIGHVGNLKRKTKKQEVHDEARAKKILSKPVKAMDAVRLCLPAINDLQMHINSLEQSNQILANVLKNHGYTKADFKKGGRQAAKKAAAHYRKDIHDFERAYTSKMTKPKKSNRKSKSSKSKSSKKSGK